MKPSRLNRIPRVADVREKPRGALIFVLALITLAIAACAVVACGGGGDDDGHQPTPDVDCKAHPEACK